MKHNHRDRQRRAGEPCTSNSFGAAFETMVKKQMYSFTALSSVCQMAAWDRETVRP